MSKKLAEILDSARVKEIVEVDTELFNDLLKLYSDQLPKRLQNLRNHFTAGERNEVELIVHTLKSSSAQLGANQLSTLCNELESQAHTCSIDYFNIQILKITQSSEELVTAIENYLKGK